MADNWAIVPFLDCPEYTTQAVADLLAQSLPTRVLLVDQGSSKATNDAMRLLAEQAHPRVLLWSYNPALPSLSAVWNRALAFCWELGATEALVVNNDVRLHRFTYETLRDFLQRTSELFVSAVGVREAQFIAFNVLQAPYEVAEVVWDVPGECYTKGGPDFSCYLIAKACHDRYPFDEGYVPAFCEDLDYHRRLMLGGDGARIFSVNLPYLHYASGTVKAMTPDARAAWERVREISRRHYRAKWGGDVNQETFHTPFGKGIIGTPVATLCLPVTTPDLQRWWQEHPDGTP